MEHLIDQAAAAGLAGAAISDARKVRAELDRLDKDHCRGPDGDAARVAWGKVSDRVKAFRRDSTPAEMGWIEAYTRHRQIGIPGQPQFGGGWQPQMGAAAFVLIGLLLVPEAVAAHAALHPEWLDAALAAP